MVKRLVVASEAGRKVVMDPRNGHITTLAGEPPETEGRSVVIEAPSDFGHSGEDRRTKGDERGTAAPVPGGAAPWPWPDVLTTFVARLPSEARSTGVVQAGPRRRGLTAGEVAEALAKVPDGSTHVIILGDGDER